MPLAVNCAGFVPFAMMAATDNSFGYEMEIIVPADSADQEAEPTSRASKIAFTDADLELRLQGAVGDPEGRLRSGGRSATYEPVFSGKHDNSILGVANKDYRGGGDRQFGAAAG